MLRIPGIVPVSDVVRMSGPHVATIERVMPEAYIAETFDQAIVMSRQTSAPVATIDGDVFRGPHLVSGGAKAEARGILQTKREIKELRERVTGERDALRRLADQTAALELTIAQATSAIAALTAEQHRQEKAIVGHEAQLARTAAFSAGLTSNAFLHAGGTRLRIFSYVADGTMSHGEPWEFFQLGTYLERACQTARILDVHYHLLLEDPWIEEEGACRALLDVMGVGDGVPSPTGRTVNEASTLLADGGLAEPVARADLDVRARELVGRRRALPGGREAERDEGDEGER